MSVEMIAEDLVYDPTFRRQREISRYLVGTLINELRGRRSMFGNQVQTKQEIADDAEKIARKFGIIAPPDDLHHAPACRAKLWAGQMLPSGPCTCGALRPRRASPPQGQEGGG